LLLYIGQLRIAETCNGGTAYNGINQFPVLGEVTLTVNHRPITIPRTITIRVIIDTTELGQHDRFVLPAVARQNQRMMAWLRFVQCPLDCSKAAIPLVQD